MVEWGDVEQVVGILQVICISCGTTFRLYDRAKSRFCDKIMKEETHFDNCVVFHGLRGSVGSVPIPARITRVR